MKARYAVAFRQIDTKIVVHIFSSVHDLFMLLPERVQDCITHLCQSPCLALKS